MTVRVHPSAVVEPGAELGSSVVIGPFSYVSKDVTIGDDSELVAHVTVLGPTRIGRRNRIFPYATVGAALLWTLEQGLGQAFTSDVRDAWTKTYTLLSSAMKLAKD